MDARFSALFAREQRNAFTFTFLHRPWRRLRFSSAYALQRTLRSLLYTQTVFIFQLTRASASLCSPLHGATFFFQLSASTDLWRSCSFTGKGRFSSSLEGCDYHFAEPWWVVFLLGHANCRLFLLLQRRFASLAFWLLHATALSLLLPQALSQSFASSLHAKPFFFGFIDGFCAFFLSAAKRFFFGFTLERACVTLVDSLISHFFWISSLNNRAPSNNLLEKCSSLGIDECRRVTLIFWLPLSWIFVEYSSF